MNELEELKARAKERRSNGLFCCTENYEDAEADLDRAIAIIETDLIPALERAIDLQVELIQGRTQARADVLKLRDHLRNIWDMPMGPELPDESFDKALADTEHYEQYREK